MQPKFQLGKVTVHLEAVSALLEAGQDVSFFLARHLSGDWGQASRELNEKGLEARSWVRSMYRTLLGREIAVTTSFASGETVVSAPAPIVEPPFRHVPIIYDAS